jgi:hypothetical protein
MRGHNWNIFEPECQPLCEVSNWDTPIAALPETNRLIQGQRGRTGPCFITVMSELGRPLLKKPQTRENSLVITITAKVCAG